MIKHVDYIWNTTSFPTWNQNSMIDTDIFAQDNCEIRVAYQGADVTVDRIVGFSQEGSAGDDDDFRIFYYNNGSFDWGSQRQSYIAGGIGSFIGSGVDYDITMGNGWVYDNLTSSYLYQGSTSTYNHNCSIRVDVGGQKVKSLQIKNGGIVVFDAFAALDNSNDVIGLFDTVSNTMFANSSLNLTYGEIISTLEISPENMSFDYTGGTSALTITAEGDWAASIGNDWLALSSTSGTGNSTINVTAQLNKGQERTGHIVIADDSNTLVCTISQENYPIIVPYNNIYINGNRIN